MADAHQTQYLAVALRLAPGTVLHADNPETATLQLPGGESVRLNERAAAILAACDGTRCAQAIASKLLQTGNPSHASADDVLDFLRVALDLGWIVASTDGR